MRYYQCMKYIIFSSVFIILFASCKKDDKSIIYGYQYFPYEEGAFVVYDVVDIIHDDPSAVHDTSHYQIKEQIGEEDVDGEGEPFRLMYRYIRDNDSLPWSLKDAWVVKKTNRSVELVEENDRMIKLAFSISYDQFWDCNALNNEDAEECYYANIYEPLSIGGLDYDSTVVVKHQDFETFIEKIEIFEVYAANVGKIHSYKKEVRINNGDTLDIEKGTELYYTATDFGIE